MFISWLKRGRINIEFVTVPILPWEHLHRESTASAVEGKMGSQHQSIAIVSSPFYIYL